MKNGQQFDFKQPIRIGSVWRPSDGSNYRVVVWQLHGGHVFYRDQKDPGKKWDKERFAFLCRYEPDVPRVEETPDVEEEE